MKKVFVNVDFSKEQFSRLESISKDFTFVYNKDESIYDSDIIVGNYPPKELKNFTNLDLILLTAVGYDAYIKKDVLNENTTLCNAVDVHSKEVAEHSLALILELVKNLHLYKNNQFNHCWKDEGQIKSIDGLRVCVVGLGDIGNYLSKLLKSLGMYVIGVKRTMIDKPEYIDELYTSKDLKTAISNVDVVVTLLPGTKDNEHLFDLEMFKSMKPDTVLVNCGRGNLYDNNLLYEVLKDNIIRACAADVFEIEPLPSDHKLYELDNFVLTPHVAGYFHLQDCKDKYFELVYENLRRYSNKEELLHVVKERE